jgi:N-methylhydantoinase A
MPFGGGGALHAGAQIREVGLASALVPRYPGVTSALGCVVADMRHDAVRTVNRLLDEVDPGALARELAADAEMGEATLARSGVVLQGVERACELDMLYLGQTHTVAVPLGTGGDLTRDGIRTAFETIYRAAFGRVLAGLPMRVVNRRVTVIGRRPKFDLAALAPTGSKTVEECRIGTRPVYADGAWCEAPIYERLDLPAGAVIAGIALLEQPDTTIFIDPGLEGRVDRFGNLVVARSPNT